MADATPDQVTAYLAEVRERSERPLGPSVGALPISSDAVRHLMESAGDVPGLLAAVEAAFKLHFMTETWPGTRCCNGCGGHWPCVTYRVVSRGLRVALDARP